MKKLLLTTVAMLAISAPVAFAQATMDLGWVGCRSAANTGSATLNDVTVAQFNCLDQANLAARVLIASAKVPAYTTFQGASVQLDIITSSAPSISNWWDVGNKVADAGNCRAGGLARGTVAAHSACANPYGAVAQAGGENFRIGDLGPGTIRFEADHVPVGGAPFLAQGTGGYAAMNVTLNLLGTWDELEGTELCTGCATPACIVLNRVDWAADGAKTVIETVTFRNYVTWFGGTGGNCPGATPTKSATWGQVKALYR